VEILTVSWVLKAYTSYTACFIICFFGQQIKEWLLVVCYWLVQKYGILGNISTSVHKNKTDLVG